MSLRLIYGRAGSGKSWFCLNEMKNSLDKGGDNPLIMIVPEQYSLQADRNMIKVLGSTGIKRADVLTFRRMAYRVFNEVGGLTRQYINSAGKCMILFRVIEELKDHLKVFSKAAKQQGFVNTLLQTFTEMKRYNITSELLKKASLDITDSDTLRMKLEDLGLIFELYQKKISEKYMDADDDLTILANKLELSRQFNGAEFWIDEFAGFTPQEYKVIEMLLHKAERVNISLCTDCLALDGQIDHSDVFYPVKNAVRKLIRITREFNISVEPPVVLREEPNYRFKESRELQHLERCYYSYPISKYIEKTRDISIFTAINIYSEVENTARDIIHLCRDRGMRYKELAVVTRNLDGYEKLIKAIFGQYSIPYFIDQKRDIISHPLVMLIISALEVFHRNWTYEAVFRYLKTGLTNIEIEDIDILENYVLACGIRGSRWTQNENWEYRMTAGLEDGDAREYELKIISKANEIRPRVVAPLMNFRSKTKGRKTSKEICTALFDFLCEIGVPQRIEDRVKEFRASGEAAIANEYTQVWNIVMEVFDQIVEVMGDEGLSLERFSQVLTIGFGEYKMGLIPAALDQVLVGSVERSKSHEVSALYVIGVNDGIFPSSVMDEGILSDRDRENLRKKGMEMAQDTRSKTFEEEFIVYNTLTTPGKYLRISYPIADHEGKSMRPSPIVFQVRKLFPNIKESSNITGIEAEGGEIDLITSPSPTFNHMVSAMRKQVEGEQVNPLWWDVYKWFRGSSEWELKCNTAVEGLSYTNAVTSINPEKTRELYGSPVYSSVSRLEKYATCPFAYFAQYGLMAKERKIFKLTAPDVGTFLHSAIDRFSSLMGEQDVTWRTLEKDWCSDAVSGVVDELLEKAGGWIFNSSKRYRYIAERLKRVITRAVWLIAEHIKRSSFEPVGYEIGFGDNENFPPIEIELNSGDKLKLTGRIDRLDAWKTEEGTYLRIVDYKSGSKAFKLCDVYYGLQIQLITYMDAVWEKGGMGMKKPILPGGMLYFRIDDPIVRAGMGATEEEIEREIMRQLKMKGLLLADVKLVKEMDRQIDGDSLIIPARINKGDVLGRSSAATAQQFDVLRKYVKKLLTRMGEEMLSGEVSMKPYKKKKVTSCTYCSYAAVCQFDPGLKDNRYRNLEERKDDEVWKLIEDEA